MRVNYNHCFVTLPVPFDGSNIMFMGKEVIVMRSFAQLLSVPPLKLFMNRKTVHIFFTLPELSLVKLY